ncbi:GNAT family N-acetyltransferase [Paenibacillus koleovorans]|uniref:GNAT family N-acetyltransferase n=1 Tax=Paenibacillus koleovorans TaxID=121608 RepID=UPI000FDAC543|nr:GNAT family N-acetyltransferase [Paenibacillus koleovorans]
MKFQIRTLRAPDDYEAVASLLNTIHSEPTTGKQLEEDEAKIPPGKLHYDEEGRLKGWDRPKWVAEDDGGKVIGYAIIWRAPWTEAGQLFHTVVVDSDSRRQGVGTALYDTLVRWAAEVRASKLRQAVQETDANSLAFAERRGYRMERHTFESVLDVAAFDRHELFDSIVSVEQSGIRFVTYADESGEENELKLYELYKSTELDIPGRSGGYPPIDEWRKWEIGILGSRPQWCHIAKDGDRYVGVVNLIQNEQTKAMYHEFTGVLREYRNRRIALALKLLGLRTAMEVGAPYLRTHNDSLNGPMLRINRELLGFTAEPGQYKMVRLLGE